VLVCNDARMKEVYWGGFARDAQGLAEAVTEERVGSPESVQVPLGWRGEIHGAGRGFRAYPVLAQRLSGQLGSVHPELLPHAREIARLAEVERLAGRAVPPEQALPVYVRDDVAQPPG
jgi:tRNA threonylcarbamoyladenosine biosynthesis protein TsaB